MVEGRGWRERRAVVGVGRGHMIRHEHTSNQCTRYYSVGYVQQMCCFVLFCRYYFQVSVFFYRLLIFFDVTPIQLLCT